MPAISEIDASAGKSPQGLQSKIRAGRIKLDGAPLGTWRRIRRHELCKMELTMSMYLAAAVLGGVSRLRR